MKLRCRVPVCVCSHCRKPECGDECEKESSAFWPFLTPGAFVTKGSTDTESTPLPHPMSALAVLGLKRSATSAEIRAAFQKLGDSPSPPHPCTSLHTSPDAEPCSCVRSTPVPSRYQLRVRKGGGAVRAREGGVRLRTARGPASRAELSGVRQRFVGQTFGQRPTLKWVLVFRAASGRS